MIPTINTPYVKTFNDKGEVTNPIKGGYRTEGANRRVRREKMQKGYTKNR